MYVLFVTISIKPEHRRQYMAEMLLNARGAREDEPGCLRFDVVQDNEDPNTIHLYEVYRDEAAFAAHQASPHYQRMAATTGDWRDGPPVLHRGVNVSPADDEWA